MKSIYPVWKEVGETPLECLERLRAKEKIPESVPMTYAGRLDPLAEGVLLILTGEECKNKEKYLDLDKEYEVEVLFGIETDTYDQLGLIRNANSLATKEINFNKYSGKFEQEYPRYSSKIIAMKGIPQEMPTKEVEIYSLEEFASREISGQEIAENSIQKIGKVTGDFRQEEILKKWQEFGREYAKNYFRVISIRVKCSSGTYMRSLAHRIGMDEKGIGAIAYSIIRPRIGNYIAD